MGSGGSSARGRLPPWPVLTALLGSASQSCVSTTCGPGRVLELGTCEGPGGGGAGEGFQTKNRKTLTGPEARADSF